MSNLSHVHDDLCSVKCILIVEDDAAIGNFLQEAIQDEIATPVLLASSGEQALHLLQTSEPALCLLDYHLPGLNGLELAHRVCSREGCEHLPILLMSSELPPINETKCHLKTLRKPFDLEKLLQLIATLLTS